MRRLVAGFASGFFSAFAAKRPYWHKMLMALMLACSAGLIRADVPDGASESKIKATFLFKFTSYVEWPASAFDQPDAPLVISVFEDDEIASELTRLTAGRVVNNHAVQVRRLSEGDSVAGCHVLFVGSTVGNRLVRILNDARSKPVLTVTELDDALTFNSIINFVLVDDQVRFDVSLPAAGRSNLKISSRLLAVAHQVVGAAP
jgi:hypothetical protein